MCLAAIRAKTYLLKKRGEGFYSRLSYAVMLIIGISGMIIAWYNTHLLGLQKFIFSMGAGVGPVFILRWFWLRINAWSQFTAMLSSLSFAVGWDQLYNFSNGFHQLVDLQLESLDLSYYTFKLICLTAVVTLSWLLVTFLTKPDDKETLRKYQEQVNPSRVKVFNMKRLLLVLLYPVISILPFLIIWQFKFGNPGMALGMTIGWVLLLYITVKQMGRIES